MREGIEKFRTLLLTDKDFQQKLKAAMEAYTGDRTEEAVFSNVLMPLASEYGISATYDEFASYVQNTQKEDSDIANDELAQIAGGSKDFGITLCAGYGIGVGQTDGSVCAIVGTDSGTGACVVEGITA